MPEPTPLPTALLPRRAAPEALWSAVARQTLDWLPSQHCEPRDALLLLPFAALLAPARQAFARASAGAAWQPRIETVQTLAASLGPPTLDPAAGPERGPCGDAALDQLGAAALLRRQAWGRDWWRRDRRGFDQAVAAVVEAAQALTQAALSHAPERRADWWDHARQVLPSGDSDPGRIEAALARSALEWAALADASQIDRAWAHRAGAWLLVQGGGPDPLARALLAQAHAQGTPVLALCADAWGDDPFDQGGDAALPWPKVQLDLARDAEDQAMAAAARVLDALAAGTMPVALVAEDRLQVRRVRALLERAGVAVHDETGWTLATTRAAAQVMALLRAAAPQAGHDAWLDWLKASGDPGAEVQTLEALWRAGKGLPADSPAQATWLAAQAALQPLRAGPRSRSVGAWAVALRQVLDAQTPSAPWHQDLAARQVRSALRLDDPPADDLPLDLDGFTDHVDATLERAVFTPPPGPPAVVVTPLARAMLRPFALAVVPGADARHLGGGGPGPTLLPEALLARLGLPTRAQRDAQRAAALAALARLPRLHLLRCRAEGDEPLADSPLLQRLDLARRAAGGPAMVVAEVALPQASVPAAPVVPPQPQAMTRLPALLSASQLQALRDCPYQFFARVVLGLREDEELDADADARDQGNWLHAVLHRFHAGRTGPDTADREAARLVALADELAQDPAIVGSLEPADLLPFRVDLEALARHYIGWLHAREAQGWRWHAGELALQAPLPGQDGLRLQGRVDRIDHGPQGQRAVLDYKTGNPDRLKRQAAAPLDAVQLAFYAALLGEPVVAQAGYVSLDARKGVATLEPEASPAELAEALAQGLAGEWQRLRQGASLPALGSGETCDRCEMRGLCRRDHWSAP